MKKLLLCLIVLLLCIDINAKREADPPEIVLKGNGGFVSTNPVFVLQSGNVLTTTFNVNTHATIVVSKAPSTYNTYSVNSEGIVSTQTVDAKEYDEVITTIDHYEVGVRYIIEIITPEGTLEGEFVITE